MTKKKSDSEIILHSYFYSLEIENVNCFTDKQVLDLSDGKGKYSPWTIILGDNGTGKTTLLKSLDRMQPDELKGNSDRSHIFPIYGDNFKLTNKHHKLKLIFNNNQTEGSYEINFLPDDYGWDVQSLGIENKTFLISFGASRRMSKKPILSKNDINLDKITSLFDESIELINVEEWYLQKYLAFNTSKNEVKIQLKQQLDLIKNVLIDFLPEVQDLRIKEIKNLKEKSSLEIKINNNNWIELRNLSFGYQTITALLVDVASKMMEQYPESKKPLSEPVIILIDEIDLHLHPKWQRVVIDKLSYHFPKAQFIVTAHSPLIVQAAQDINANIVVCRKEGDRVVIDNKPESVKGWRIDQILTSDLFGLGSAQSIEFENLRNEKINILLNKTLSKKNRERLKKIDEELNRSPIFSNKDSIDAEKLIKKAAELLKK